ncbi:MAG: polysaccharide deacetylase family protein [Clostridia bacterium]|nr:polysaccharide deacetylase family protein [Clostridia bacterium]
MKRRIIAMLMLLCLLLAGCSEAVPQKEQAPPAAENQAPQKTYAEKPAVFGEKTVFVNGVQLSAVYGAEGELLSLKELAAAVGGSVTTTEAEDGDVATLQLGEQQYTFSAEQGGIYTGEDWFVPAAKLEEMGYHLFTDEEKATTYYTAYPTNEQVPDGVKVPTLMYHAVSDNCWGIRSLFVSPARMEEQLQYLLENGYTPIHFEDLGRVDQIEKPILLTFDDGYDDNYTELFPILKKYNVKATVFIIIDLLGTEHYMTAEQAKEMSDSGLVSIQSHTMSHAYLSQISEKEMEHELGQSKLEVTRITGKESFAVAYPSGEHNDASLAITAKYYEFGIWMRGTIYKTGDDPYVINRKYVARSTTISDYKNLIGA